MLQQRSDININMTIDGEDKQATAVCAVKINVYITTFGCY